MIEPCYRYRAQLVRMLDGDTYVLDIDLGFRVRTEVEVRIRGVDTPERGEPGFAAATEFARSKLAAGPVV